jgi:carbonic anhydrase/acetyltransferase-like protein (isoleucine patch superfamily)
MDLPHADHHLTNKMRTHLPAIAAASFVLLVAPPAATQHPPAKSPAKPATKQVESHGAVTRPTSGRTSTPAKGHAAAGDHSTLGGESSSCASLSRVSAVSPVVPETAGPGFASFVDPSARVEGSHRVMIGCRSYVGPFASLDGSAGPIAIGDDTNVQDNVVISGKLVVLGDHVIIAHGATIVGPATVGTANGKPAFVGFNSWVEGAMIEPDAMVTHLVKVSAGVVIRSGTKVLPGKWIRTQDEADNPALGKVTAVTDADREFMRGVLHVNAAFASGYTDLYQSSPALVRGIGRDPGHSDFNHEADLPTLAGIAEARPDFPARIIGAVVMSDSVRQLEAKLGKNISIRADEGEHFRFGHVGSLQDRVTFHALEHTDLSVGNNGTFGYHVVVHGGPDDASEPRTLARIEDDVTVKDWAVVFRSKVGRGVTIGVRAYVDGSQLAAGTVVPDRAIMIKNKIVGTVEW